MTALNSVPQFIIARISMIFQQFDVSPSQHHPFDTSTLLTRLLPGNHNEIRIDAQSAVAFSMLCCSQRPEAAKGMVRLFLG